LSVDAVHETLTVVVVAWVTASDPGVVGAWVSFRDDPPPPPPELHGEVLDTSEARPELLPEES
jgi:hypothetical protein